MAGVKIAQSSVDALEAAHGSVKRTLEGYYAGGLSRDELLAELGKLEGAVSTAVPAIKREVG